MPPGVGGDTGIAEVGTPIEQRNGVKGCKSWLGKLLSRVDLQIRHRLLSLLFKKVQQLHRQVPAESLEGESEAFWAVATCLEALRQARHFVFLAELTSVHTEHTHELLAGPALPAPHMVHSATVARFSYVHRLQAHTSSSVASEADVPGMGGSDTGGR